MACTTTRQGHAWHSRRVSERRPRHGQPRPDACCTRKLVLGSEARPWPLRWCGSCGLTCAGEGYKVRCNAEL
eukprot:101009-Chlamydomonas_euryale.AAC.2